MEKNQPKEITLIDIIKDMFRNKIVVLCFTLVIAILGTVLFGVLPNKKDVFYSAKFSFVLPSSDVFNLPKERNLEYTFITAPENIKETKAKDPSFSTIDVDKIIEEHGISIVKNIEFLEDKTTMIECYVINVDSNYFENFEQV